MTELIIGFLFGMFFGGIIMAGRKDTKWRKRIAEIEAECKIKYDKLKAQYDACKKTK